MLVVCSCAVHAALTEPPIPQHLYDLSIELGKQPKTSMPQDSHRLKSKHFQSVIWSPTEILL